MIINQVKIHNFCLFNDVDVALGNETYSILGVNQDDDGSSSNGSGKSMFLEAIIWGLFGKVVRPDMLTDDVIGGHDTYTQVVLDITHQGKRLIIDRVRNHPERKNGTALTVDGQDVKMHKNDETDRLIAQHLGFNFSAFCLAAFNSTLDKFKQFASLTPTQMIASLSEMLDIDRFDAYNETCKELLRECKLESQRVETQFTSLTRERSSQEKSANALVVLMEEFEEKKQEKLFVKEKNLATLIEEQASLHLKADGIEQSRQAYQEAEKNTPSDTELTSAIQTLRGKILVKDRAIQIATNQAAKIQTKIEALIKEYDNLVNNVTGHCSYCGSKIKDHKALNERSAEIYQDLETLRLDLSEEEAKAVIATKQKKGLESEIDALQSEFETYRKQRMVKDELYRELRDKEEAQRQAARLQVTILKTEEEIKAIQKSEPTSEKRMLEETLERVVQIDQELKDLKEELNKIEKTESAVKFLQSVLKHVKRHVLYQFIESLGEEIRLNLEHLGSCLQVKIEVTDKELQILYTNSSKQGEFYKYGIFSTGEKARIDKAVMIALNNLFRIGVYMDDEGLRSVDSGTSHILDFLLSHKQGTTLLVFHNDLIQDYLRRHHVKTIEIKKHNGCSTATIRD
jgi:DNA repair exonuclease SbcCD ATPase subunit